MGAGGKGKGKGAPAGPHFAKNPAPRTRAAARDAGPLAALPADPDDAQPSFPGADWVPPGHSRGVSGNTRDEHVGTCFGFARTWMGLYFHGMVDVGGVTQRLELSFICYSRPVCH